MCSFSGGTGHAWVYDGIGGGGEGVRCWKRVALGRTSPELKGGNPEDYAAATVRN